MILHSSFALTFSSTVSLEMEVFFHFQFNFLSCIFSYWLQPGLQRINEGPEPLQTRTNKSGEADETEWSMLNSLA